MQVIMVKTGEMKQVPDGYARNYLLPNKLATAATDANVEEAKVIQAKHLADQQARQAEYAQLGKTLMNLKLEIAAAANEQGKLFAALKASDVVKQLTEHKLAISEEMIKMPAIKHTGDYKVTVRIPEQASVEVTLVVKAA